MKGVRSAVAAVLLLSGCNPQPAHQPSQTEAPTQAPSGMPPLTITGHGTGKQLVRVIGQRAGGGKMYELLARSYESRSMQNTTQATFRQAQVAFYDKDGTTLQARSPQAHINEHKQVILSGGVHAKTSTGLTLVCDQLVYDDATGMLHGTGGVRITGAQGGQQQVLTGNSFTSDVKLTRMTMR